MRGRLWAAATKIWYISWLVCLLGIASTFAVALDVRHGGHDTDAHGAQPSDLSIPPFCTVASASLANDSSCIALDAVDTFVSAQDDGPALRPAPRRIESGHHAHQGTAAPLEELNETALFIHKGPVPLSYIEWDFNLGAGQLSELRRFTSAQADQILGQWPDRVVMSSSNGYWRSLEDQHYVQGQESLRADVKNRISNDGHPQEPTRHRTLWVLCSIQFFFACFVFLPVLLCLQAVKSSLAPLLALLYLGNLTSCLLLGQLYFSLSPALYSSNVLGGMARALYVLSLGCFVPEVLKLGMRFISTAHNASAQLFSIQGLREQWLGLLKGDHRTTYYKPTPQRSHSSASSDRTLHHSSFSANTPDKEQQAFILSDTEDGETHLLQSPGSSDIHPLGNSVYDSHHATALGQATDRLAGISHRYPRLTGFASLLYTMVSRGLVPLAFAVLYVGISIYTGACRKPYKNACLAHGIKGGIFFWYGVLCFVRFLGAFGEYGWAWNKRPTVQNSSDRRDMAQWRRTMPSAEFVECFVIFLYGISNTWLERLDAKPNDPYTIKQIQHISIAIMFWFVGLVGMGLESTSLRSLIAKAVVHMHPSVSIPGPSGTTVLSDEEMLAKQTPPPSYAYSFNPFPALVIGVTGVAMAAHHQDYVYEVQIHILWGEMLAAFALFRMLTYFLLWLRPPSSVLPSRPPTEILASFALTCGGLLFMLSNEEVSFAAMRAGYADFMAILNVAVALVALVFTWCFAIIVIKAWALQRERRSYTQTRIRSPHQATKPWVVSYE
ncbi:hypothetical protein MYAM1_000174 [Malassezia yamatoensis]|uniref:Protein YTP1-like C-terminal domain-containing protein n=1 Tax=Malassezia yamatoensis TaxID=253288 RepID=A0AAJ5YQQ5_9BASI|nr:hypothetical protein MYAM1_000174 [Malassezia yamatoensis]